MKQPTLRTARLTLRPLVAEDAPAVQRLVSSIEIARNTLMIPHPYPDGAAAEWIAQSAKAVEEGSALTFAIDDGELSGAIGLMLRDGIGEFGYWIGVEKWGRGYATEALAEILRYGFEELDLMRIFACHFTRNPASGRAMQKNGMTYEGTLRRHVKKWDEYVDLAYYGLLREEWISRRSAETA
ncbi:MAG TPA: GNAT family protein [Thermoanaerobaculia bacterium]|nr:GNAT family protein [Thermoanaerobaculia bacterium]